MAEELYDIKRDAVLFEGGPWDGFSRYKDEVFAAARAEEGQGFVFPYVNTKRTKKHPWTERKAKGIPAVMSAVWSWQPPKDVEQLHPSWRHAAVPQSTGRRR